jgi:hypothetical protein
MSSPDLRDPPAKEHELKMEEIDQLSEETFASNPRGTEYYEKHEETFPLALGLLQERPLGNNTYSPLMMADPFLAHMMMVNGVDKLKFLSQESKPAHKDHSRSVISETLQLMKEEST